MKSTTMLAELRQAHADGAKLDAAYLEMFIRLGSAKVKREIVELIGRNSTATSLLSRDYLFAFLLGQVKASIERHDSEDFRDNCDSFLSKLYGYTLSDDLRRKTLQGFIDTISPHRSSPYLTEYAVNSVMRWLIRLFPNVLEDKAFRLNPQFREHLYFLLHEYDAYRTPNRK